MKGVVVKKSGDKTVAVSVAKERHHGLYGKKIVKTRRFLVHDPDNKAQVGDLVTIRSTRPVSARKRWVIENYGS
ncbi:MAG: 30S ribosomal protein S17 [bacterium]